MENLNLLQQFLFCASGIVIGWAFVMALRREAMMNDFRGLEISKVAAHHR